jgi:hypothetical protein
VNATAGGADEEAAPAPARVIHLIASAVLVIVYYAVFYLVLKT